MQEESIVLQRQRRPAASFPVVHPDATIKNIAQFYTQQYLFLANFVHQQKPTFVIEISFVMPKDEAAYGIMKEKHKLKQGIAGQLKLLVYPFWPSQKLTARNFFKALPKIQLIQYNVANATFLETDYLDTLAGNSAVSGSLYQLLKERRYDFEILKELQTVNRQFQQKIVSQPEQPFIIKSDELHSISFMFFQGNYLEVQGLMDRIGRVIMK